MRGWCNGSHAVLRRPCLRAWRFDSSPAYQTARWPSGIGSSFLKRPRRVRLLLSSPGPVFQRKDAALLTPTVWVRSLPGSPERRDGVNGQHHGLQIRGSRFESWSLCQTHRCPSGQGRGLQSRRHLGFDSLPMLQNSRSLCFRGESQNGAGLGIGRRPSKGNPEVVGLACTKAGDRPLQGQCGRFDSDRVHQLEWNYTGASSNRRTREWHSRNPGATPGASTRNPVVPPVA